MFNIIFTVLGFFVLAFAVFGMLCCIYVGAESDMSPKEKEIFRKKRKKK